MATKVTERVRKNGRIKRLAKPVIKPAIKPLISDDTLKQLYTTMLKSRMLEARVHLFCEREIFAGNYNAAVGLEACAVGTTIGLRPEDSVAPSDGEFMTRFTKGLPLVEIFSQLCAPAATSHVGCSPLTDSLSDQLNVIIPSSTIGSHVSVATGVALHYKLKKQENVAVVFAREESTTLGYWHEALSLAGAQRLPIIFVVHSNLCAGSLPIDLQPAVEDTSMEAPAYGFPDISVDGNDVVAVYRVAQESIRRARQGSGPTLIECKTYPGFGDKELDQVTAQHHSLKAWELNDPILQAESYLAAKKLFSPEWKQCVIADFNKELDDAIRIVQTGSIATAARVS